MTDVFISYASEDRGRARQLATLLEARGWSVWWDRNITAGQTYDKVIEHELDTAKSVVVLWSTDSISSEWVKNEAAVAAARDVLVPALIDNVKLPLEFRRKQTADLVGWDGNPLHGGFQALCDGVAAKANLMGVAPLQSSFSAAPGFRWRRRWILCAIAAIAVTLGLGAYWKLFVARPSLSGTWNITQIHPNQSQHYGALELTQQGATLAGKLLWETHAPGEIVAGRVEGDRVRFMVEYKGGLQGVYEGTLNGSRNRVDGFAKGGGTEANWFATRK